MGSVRGRLGRLERCVAPPRRLHLYLAFVDEQGLVIDDRSEAVRPWVGQHYRELPHPVSIIQGVDPLIVLGYKKPDDQTRTRGVTA